MSFLEIVRDSKKLNSLLFYTELFDKQLSELKKGGCPKAILQVLADNAEKVLNFAISTVPISTDHFPFVPVIPREFIGIYGQMNFLNPQYANNGALRLNPGSIKEDSPRLQVVHYIFDINVDGNAKDLNLDAGLAFAFHNPEIKKPVVFRGSDYFGAHPFLYESDLTGLTLAFLIEDEDYPTYQYRHMLELK